jgi:hypothetical protein
MFNIPANQRKQRQSNIVARCDDRNAQGVGSAVALALQILCW